MPPSGSPLLVLVSSLIPVGTDARNQQCTGHTPPATNKYSDRRLQWSTNYWWKATGSDRAAPRTCLKTCQPEHNAVVSASHPESLAVKPIFFCQTYNLHGIGRQVVHVAWFKRRIPDQKNRCLTDVPVWNVILAEVSGSEMTVATHFALFSLVLHLKWWRSYLCR